MKNWIQFFSIFFVINLFAQNIIGTVIDANYKPLAGANVYLDGSSIATATDKNGDFILPINAKTNLALVVSFVGYQSQYFKKYDVSKKIIIFLEPIVNQLNEVVIEKPKFTRK